VSGLRRSWLGLYQDQLIQVLERAAGLVSAFKQSVDKYFYCLVMSLDL
jgi:hypothetical protein